jgi:hypothetical protein
LSECRYSIFPATFAEASVFLHHVFGTFVKNQVGIAVWIHIWVLYSVPLAFMPGFVQCHAVFIAMAL